MGLDSLLSEHWANGLTDRVSTSLDFLMAEADGVVQSSETQMKIVKERKAREMDLFVNDALRSTDQKVEEALSRQ